MFELIGVFLWLVLTGFVSVGGYLAVKRFVQNRLRYVDALHRPAVPAFAGVLAAVAAVPVVALLPFVTLSTAVLFGIGIGTGVAAGRRELKRLPGG